MCAWASTRPEAEAEARAWASRQVITLWPTTTTSFPRWQPPGGDYRRRPRRPPFRRVASVGMGVTSSAARSTQHRRAEVIQG